MIEEDPIRLSFPYIKGNLPHYSNAVIVNAVAEEIFILDFGFFDPLSIRDLSDKIKPYEVEPVTRILLSREVALQLLESLIETLDIQPSIDTED